MQYKYQTIVVPFLYGPILPKRSHFIVGLWWATGPTWPWYWPNFTPNYGVMMSRWIFSVLFEIIIVNWNRSQRWFSEVAPVSLKLWLKCKSKVCNFWLFFMPLDYKYRIKNKDLQVGKIDWFWFGQIISLDLISSTDLISINNINKIFKKQICILYVQNVSVVLVLCCLHLCVSGTVNML